MSGGGAGGATTIITGRSDLVIRNVSETTKKKLMKLKEDQGFGDKDWGEWFFHMTADVRLQDSISETIQKHTRDSLLKLWVQNLATNLPYIMKGETIKALVPDESAKLEEEGYSPDVALDGRSAVVIGRGPSLYKEKHLERLASSGYRGTVVCTDGALIDVLEAGIEPNRYDKFLVVSVDGNREKIWRWYDSPLVDKYGPYIHAIICSMCATNVVERLEKAGAHYYFFHPIFDDVRNIESYTKIEQLITMSERHPDGVPACQAGGHAGATAWVMSWAVLRRNPVALIGLNLGYLPEDDITKTYYWQGLIDNTHGNTALAESQYERIYNPDLNEFAVTDPVFRHYREGFLDMLSKSPYWLDTINCTGGGALFGPRIRSQSFQGFLKEHAT